MKETIILGSGMADLGDAHRCRELGVPAVIYDKKDHHGGYSSLHSLRVRLTLDAGPHTSHMNTGWPVFVDCVGAQ